MDNSNLKNDDSKSDDSLEGIEKILNTNKSVFENNNLPPIKNLDKKVQNILDQTIFIRNKPKKPFAYKNFWPIAASFVVLINGFYIFQALDKGNNIPSINNEPFKSVASSSIPTTLATSGANNFSKLSSNNSILRQQLTPYSLSGTLFSQSPSLVHPGKDGQEVVIGLKENTPSRLAAKKISKKRFTWQELGYSPLGRGKKIQIIFSVNHNKNSNSEKTMTKEFYVLSPEQAQALQALIKTVNKTEEKAQILYDHFCYSEALDMALSLVSDDPKNIKNWEFIRDCYEKLGCPDDAKQIQQKIENLQKDL